MTKSWKRSECPFCHGEGTTNEIDKDQNVWKEDCICEPEPKAQAAKYNAMYRTMAQSKHDNFTPKPTIDTPPWEKKSA